MNLTGPTAQLFLVFGGGWRHYNLIGADFNTSDVAADDDVMTIPAGFGVAYHVGKVVTEVRFIGRSTMYTHLMPPEDGGEALRLDHWTATGHVGFEL